MSDELRLPDDLAGCEARLAAMAPPATGIDRDELMYRAGWAAALAGTSTSSARLAAEAAPQRRSTAALCAASAALAATLAVVVTLNWRPREESPAPTAWPIAPPIAEVDVPASSAATPAANRAGKGESFAGAAPLGAKAGSLAPLMATRRRELARLVDGSPFAALEAAVYVRPDPAKSAQQLLEELLPESAVKPAVLSPASLWPFRSIHSGESI